ncbi:hypothetical protein BU17DRAFT_60921 [Hysterangium stoloniferum]|nr:hypothetical protein BU17DRAFT_60921 [Hysterangium stoloniferum]
MVFANLTEQDKDAFFALLDEYFASRPELAEALQLRSPAQPNISSGVAAAHRVLASNPQATSSAISAGLRTAPKLHPSKYTAAASNPELASAIGRVAAASLALNNAPPSPRTASNDLRPPPPPVPRRAASESPAGAAAEPPPPPLPRAGIASGAPPHREIGRLGSASRKLWGAQTSDDPPAAPAAARKPAPPPRRAALPPPRARTPTPEPEPEPEPDPEEDEEQGEWAEALYDYTSADPNDLQLRSEQRVFITERTSDDWWTGQADGKTGLVPAAYVKLL